MRVVQFGHEHCLALETVHVQGLAVLGGHQVAVDLLDSHHTATKGGAEDLRKSASANGAWVQLQLLGGNDPVIRQLCFLCQLACQRGTDDDDDGAQRECSTWHDSCRCLFLRCLYTTTHTHTRTFVAVASCHAHYNGQQHNGAHAQRAHNVPRRVVGRVGVRPQWLERRHRAAVAAHVALAAHAARAHVGHGQELALGAAPKGSAHAQLRARLQVPQIIQVRLAHRL